MLLLNSPLYGTGSLCVLTRRPWMGRKARGEKGMVQSVMEDKRLEKIEKE